MTEAKLKKTLAKLVSGEPPDGEVEERLLRDWNGKLDKLERYAVAAAFDLPYTPQAPDDLLARAALKKLGVVKAKPRPKARRAG